MLTRVLEDLNQKIVEESSRQHLVDEAHTIGDSIARYIKCEIHSGTINNEEEHSSFTT